ncbi:MAG: alpha-glucosidase C-terminal domain-containing protein, partial [Bacteroidales bacterium]|nr:alpha-glucosidase C-terminal domain-containing protein [Bacteroidales bacterium]
DGFRCDVAHQVPVDFWNEVRPALQEVKPDVLLVAEAEQRNLHEHAFDITYAWEFHHLMNEIAQGHQSVKAIDDYFTRSDTLYNPNDMRMYFTSNHDENSWNGTVFERLGKAAETMAVLSFTIPGIPLIYNGQEAGLNHRLKFFEKDQIVWRTHPFEKLYQRLNQLKEEESALWNPGFGGTYTRLATENDSSLLAFIRSKGNNRVVCLFNLTNQSQNGSLTEIKGNFHDYFSGEHWKSNVFTLEPWGYRVLVKK